MKYFEVIAKCGHVEKNYCVFVNFACVAENGKEAAAKVREYPRVKHDRKDAIRCVKEITFEEFVTLRAENDADPYLHCKNRQEQRNIPGFEERIKPDIREEQIKKKRSPIGYIKMMNREEESMRDSWQYFLGGATA